MFVKLCAPRLKRRMTPRSLVPLTAAEGAVFADPMLSLCFFRRQFLLQ
jgi:hypothetical protein